MRFSRQTTESKGIHNIDEWYQGDTGQYLFEQVRERISPLLATTFGYYSLQIGCTGLSTRLLESCRVKHQFTLEQLLQGADIKACPALLPIASDSVDLVVLMHHLSNTAEPHAILREAFRVLIPEGKLIIIDFNPVSLWGVRHFFQGWLEKAPWNGHYYTASRLHDWMNLLGFDQHRHYRQGYLPPIQKISLTRRLGWLEKGMKNWLPMFSAINILVYSKNISPMTPVRHRWVTRKLLPSKVARPSVGHGMNKEQ